ncbi:hypothetical protein KC318_g2323 [Hortaea werneckii]|nr:hypothetical protein KC334_g3746 [Hortaea werneckii]KAI7009496.1 hypothetical protein KC355_g6529 [Hortaea werneckii]KAI7594176.1 hypothetical protein KC316_g1279 [Hortaea werneckii]KAI7673288.1 hypothetical protein KC318_g2323 [Hortaea werneckii]
MALIKWMRRLLGRLFELLRRETAFEEERPETREERKRVETLVCEVLAATRAVLTHPCAEVRSKNWPNEEGRSPYDGGAIGLLNAGEDCEWPQRILSLRQIDELILSSKHLPNGAYLTQQLNAPCGDLGGFWGERKEWQVLGIAVCKKLRIRQRICEQVSFAAEKENAKQAGRELTERLYEAAKPHCRIEAYMFVVKREYIPYYQYDDGSIGKPTRETLYLFKDVEFYQRLATILAEKAPEKITRDMLSLLRKEIAGRRIVDAWHNELLDGSPRKSELRVHKKFTEGLETMFPISQTAVLARSEGTKRTRAKDASLVLPDLTQPSLSGVTAFDIDWRASVKQLEWHAGMMRKKRDILRDTRSVEALLELPCWAVCYVQR